jgi:hypothetical protein
VKCTNLFTVVTVNGVQVYFQRGTGTLDGVGVQARDWAPAREAPARREVTD